jgi:hypothetical protein
MSRVPAATVLAVTGWTAAGWLLPGTPGAWALFPLLGLLPGLAAARLVPLEPGGLARAAVALAASPLIATTAAYPLLRAGLGLASAAQVVGALSWAVWVALEWRAARAAAPPREAVPATRLAWGWAAGGGLLVALVLFSDPWLRLRGDAWVHGGIIWDLIERGMPPEDPRFAGMTLNYVWFFNLFIALLASVRGGDPFAFMAVSNAASLAAVLAIGWLLGRRVWGDARAAAGAALLTGLGLNAGMWLLWPLRLLRGLLGEDRGPEAVARELAMSHWNDAQVIFDLAAPFTHMVSFLDKFLHGTALNVAYLQFMVFLWAWLAALGGGGARALAWGAAGAAGMMLFHGVVGLSVLPVAAAAATVVWRVAGRGGWPPLRGRLAAFAAAAAAGAALTAPYTLAITRGWAPSRSGLRHSFLQFDPWMPWTLVSALAVTAWFARRPLRRALAERRGDAALLALFAAGMVAFALAVTLPLGNSAKFLFQAFIPLAVLGGAGFHDELAAWRRRLGRAGAAAAVALVLGATPVLTVRGYLVDPSGATAPELHPAPGEAILYAWMRDSLARHAVVVDHGFRSAAMVMAGRQLYLGDRSGPERAAFPLDQLTERRAVMTDLYGPADSLARDAAALARLGRPAVVVVRDADFTAARTPRLALGARPDLFTPVYDRAGHVVYHVYGTPSPTRSVPWRAQR